MPPVPLEQTPARQIWPLEQAVPQPPQLLALVAVLTQTPLQSVGLAVEQVQTLPWQVWPAKQALPQEPQLALLVAVLTQVVPHRVGVVTGHVQVPA